MQYNVIERLLNGEVICQIGQIDDETARALDAMARKGTAVKWRGYWAPSPGANFGIGPLKSCWGIPEYLQSPFVQNLSPINACKREAA